MGCSGCSNAKDGKPAGCKSNGYCSSSGCNKLDVFDWLAGVPIALNERFGGWPGRILVGATLLTPLWSLLLFHRFGYWLARPFLWRDLSDLQLSSRVRTALVILKWTAIHPGGGLANPACLALRSIL